MNRVVLFDMSSHDPEKQAKFYADVFGWEVAAPNWGYHPVKTGPADEPGIDGGITGDFPQAVRLQIQVDSIDASAAKAVENGATVEKGKMEFDDFYLAYLIDPVGVHYGLIEYKRQ